MKRIAIDLNPGGGQTQYARCLRARYNAGMTKHRGVASGILEIYEETDMCDAGKRQNKSEPQGQDEQQLLPEVRDQLARDEQLPIDSTEGQSGY